MKQVTQKFLILTLKDNEKTSHRIEVNITDQISDNIKSTIRLLESIKLK